MASRLISDLIPEVAAKVEFFVAACAARGVEVMVYCTYRSAEEQALLYAVGRTVPGKVVTKAKPWESAHQYRRAADCVPMVLGKPLWTHSNNSEEWQVFAEEAERAGLEWAGRWTRFREYVHVQDLGGQSMAHLRAAAATTGVA